MVVCARAHQLTGNAQQKRQLGTRCHGQPLICYAACIGQARTRNNQHALARCMARGERSQLRRRGGQFARRRKQQRTVGVLGVKRCCAAQHHLLRCGHVGPVHASIRIIVRTAHRPGKMLREKRRIAFAASVIHGKLIARSAQAFGNLRQNLIPRSVHQLVAGTHLRHRQAPFSPSCRQHALAAPAQIATRMRMPRSARRTHNLPAARPRRHAACVRAARAQRACAVRV